MLLALVLAAAAAVALGACREPGCEVDLDCPALQRCESGSCEPIDLVPYLEGLCAADRDCSSGEVCRDGRCAAAQETSACGHERDPTCEARGELCTLDPGGGCIGEEPCRAKLACAPPVGEKIGMIACEADAECASGACVGGACLRVCDSDTRCPAGFTCRAAALPDGREVRRCAGVRLDGTPDDEQTRCRADRDCEAPRVCAFFDPTRDDDNGATPVCQVPGPFATLSTRDRCVYIDECPGNLCVISCEREADYADACDTFRCSHPCETNADCPPLTVCSQIVYDLLDEGQPIKFCSLGEGGCADDVDCCPRRDAEGRCLGGWSTEREHCGLLERGSHVSALCQPVGEKLAPGDPCDEAAACSTGLCEPDPDGQDRCTTVCDATWDRCPLGPDPRLTCQPAVRATVPTLHVCR